MAIRRGIRKDKSNIQCGLQRCDADPDSEESLDVISSSMLGSLLIYSGMYAKVRFAYFRFCWLNCKCHVSAATLRKYVLRKLSEIAIIKSNEKDCQNAQLLTSEPGKMSPLVPQK